MNKKFAVFDMDGTLVDSMGVWQNLGCEYLASKGIAGDFIKDWDKIAAMTVVESAELFIQHFSLSGTAEAIAAEMNGRMDVHYREDIALKPGVKEYLETLCAAGVRMCVASATAEELMEACLKRLGVWSYFDFILSCESMGTNKRKPEIYLEAAKRFAAAPAETAVYEDAVYAVETAKKAGFYVVGVYDEATGSSWRRICGLADETIESFE